jgi:hypothetical protein
MGGTSVRRELALDWAASTRTSSALLPFRGTSRDALPELRSVSSRGEPAILRGAWHAGLRSHRRRSAEHAVGEYYHLARNRSAGPKLARPWRAVLTTVT